MVSLNDKQKRFCEEYPIDFNATQAAIRAGYSKKTANEQASRLLANVNIQNYIKELSAPAIESLNISRERTMKEIGLLAFQDVRKFYNNDGSLIPIHLLDDEAAAAIAGMDIEEIFAEGVAVGVVKKIKRYDKTKALEMLARHFKIYDDGGEKVINININGRKVATG